MAAGECDHESRWRLRAGQGAPLTSRDSDLSNVTLKIPPVVLKQLIITLFYTYCRKQFMECMRVSFRSILFKKWIHQWDCILVDNFIVLHLQRSVLDLITITLQLKILRYPQIRICLGVPWIRFMYLCKIPHYTGFIPNEGVIFFCEICFLAY